MGEFDVRAGGARASPNCRALNLVVPRISEKKTIDMEKMKKNKETNSFFSSQVPGDGLIAAMIHSD